MKNMDKSCRDERRTGFKRMVSRGGQNNSGMKRKGERHLFPRSLTQAFERAVSVELWFHGRLIGWGKLGKVVQRMVEGRLGNHSVVVFVWLQGASCGNLHVVHTGCSFCGRQFNA